jgi:4-azaleucine resistance transporter AzlC
VTGQPEAPDLPPERGLREGVRAGAPFAVVALVLALSFGVVATEAGFPPLAAVVMSAVVFGGSAQFTSVGILAGGGSVGAAVAAAGLMGSRYVPMGFAVGPSLRGRRWRRALEGQLVVDSSWAMAARGDGTFDRDYLLGHGAVQYAFWVLGTAVGVLLPDLDARALGLDALFPAFFLTLLHDELRNRLRIGVALAGAVIALVLIPVAPAGVPVLVACSAALVGLRRPG